MTQGLRQYDIPAPNPTAATCARTLLPANPDPKITCTCAHSISHIASLLIHHSITYRHRMSVLYGTWILTGWDEGIGWLKLSSILPPSLSLLIIPRPSGYTDTSRRSLGYFSRHAVLLSFYQPVDTATLCSTVSLVSIITITILLFVCVGFSMNNATTGDGKSTLAIGAAARVKRDRGI